MGAKYALLRIMHLPEDVVDVTSDGTGNYLGMLQGDVGYNLYLGKPNPRPQWTTVQLAWQHWTRNKPYQRAVVNVAKAKGVRLRDFLPKVSRGVN